MQLKLHSFWTTLCRSQHFRAIERHSPTLLLKVQVQTPVLFAPTSDRRGPGPIRRYPLQCSAIHGHGLPQDPKPSHTQARHPDLEPQAAPLPPHLPRLILPHHYRRGQPLRQRCAHPCPHPVRRPAVPLVGPMDAVAVGDTAHGRGCRPWRQAPQGPGPRRRPRAGRRGRREVGAQADLRG